MRKSVGLIVLLIALALLTSVWEYYANEGEIRFLTIPNAKNQLTWIGLFGILALGQAVVIITGGIDLSIGSVVALTGIVAAMLMNREGGMSPIVALPICLVMCGGIGLAHGLLVTRMRMQPFVVTLCGLFIYRGIARFITGDRTQGFGTGHEILSWFGGGSFADLAYGTAQPNTSPLQLLVAPFLVMLLLACVLTAYLHFSARGRHLFALGANEEAARLAGINTGRNKILAYVLCGVITGLGGLLWAFKVRSLGPSNFGSFYELYAIAGCVLGGCSLRGGTGNVLGVILGIALIVVLRNLVNILEISSQLEFAVIGGTILLGVSIDELMTRRSMRSTSRTG